MTPSRMELVDLKGVILSFRITDLQALLASFGCSYIGRKNDLQSRALTLLFDPPQTVNTEKYKQKIRELFREEQQSQMQQNSPNNRNLIVQQRGHGTLTNQFSQPAPVRNNIMGSNATFQIDGNYAYSTMYVQTPEIVECNISNTVQFRQRTTPSNVRFKKLPFFNVKQEVLPPRVLMMNSPTTLRLNNGRVNNTHEFTISFILTCDIASDIAMHRDITNKKYAVQLQLRTCTVESNISIVPASEFDDFMPLGLTVRVNGVQCTTALPPLSPSSRPNQDVRRIPGPIDLSAWLRLSPKNINILTINWIPEITKTFYITLNLVENLSSNFLLDKLKVRPPLTIDFTKLMIRKQYRRVIDDDTSMIDNDDDDDIATTIVRVSLMCPLAKFRMIHPAKGKNCGHLQCFDGFAFISMNEKKSMWICPVCHKRLSFDDLLIDQYFVDVLENKELSDDCQEVQLLIDGSWKSYFEESTCDAGDEKQNTNLPVNFSASSSVSNKDSAFEVVKSMTDNVATIVRDIVTNGTDTVVDLTFEDEEEISNDGENFPATQQRNTSTVPSPTPCPMTPASTEVAQKFSEEIPINVERSALESLRNNSYSHSDSGSQSGSPPYNSDQSSWSEVTDNRTNDESNNGNDILPEGNKINTLYDEIVDVNNGDENCNFNEGIDKMNVSDDGINEKNESDANSQNSEIYEGTGKGTVSKPVIQLTENDEDKAIATSKRHLKIRDKRYLCPFCEKNVSSFAKHLIRVHQNEEEVRQIQILSKLSKERKLKIALIRKRGAQMQLAMGTVNAVKRPKKVKEDMTYITCVYCAGLYLSTSFRRHIIKCEAKVNGTFRSKRWSATAIACNIVQQAST